MAQAPVPTSKSPADIRHSFSLLAKRSDIALALGIVLMLVFLILPLPTWLLDITLALSITDSIKVHCFNGRYLHQLHYFLYGLSIRR